MGFLYFIGMLRVAARHIFVSWSARVVAPFEAALGGLRAPFAEDPAGGLDVRNETCASNNVIDTAEIPSVVYIGQAGVPKTKKSIYLKTRRTAGVHFRHRHLRYQSWYFCPLCAEPKQQGTCCRREDCRETKP